MNALILNNCKYAYNYCKLLSSFGINADVCDNPLSPQKYDFLLLCGGGDVNPTFYSSYVYNCHNVNTYRDVIELSTIERFVCCGKRIIGICRGLQILNVYFGGTLENVPRQENLSQTVLHSSLTGKDEKHLAYTHPYFCNSLNKTVAVNSAHKQRIQKLAQSFLPVFTAPDGTIEGIASKNLPVVAFQFHPERMTEGFLISGKDLFSFALNYLA